MNIDSPALNRAVSAYQTDDALASEKVISVSRCRKCRVYSSNSGLELAFHHQAPANNKIEPAIQKGASMAI